MFPRASAMQAGTSTDAIFIGLLPRTSARGVLIRSASATCARLQFSFGFHDYPYLMFNLLFVPLVFVFEALFGPIINWSLKKFVQRPYLKVLLHCF